MAKLCPSEVRRIEAAKRSGNLLRWKESNGAWVAYAGHDEQVLFSSRGWEAFQRLWEQAQSIYARSAR